MANNGSSSSMQSDQYFAEMLNMMRDQGRKDNPITLQLGVMQSKDSVKIVDAEWDFVEDIYGVYHSMPKHLFDEYVKSEEKPKIIHYSAKRKPWINISSKYNIPFWEVANTTVFAEELKLKMNND